MKRKRGMARGTLSYFQKMAKKTEAIQKSRTFDKEPQAERFKI